jgi:PAS domain S-box-containing protein
MREFPLDLDKLESVLNHLNLGVYITNLERRIVLWNRKATEITGFRAEDVVGSACHDNVLVHTDKDGHNLCRTDHCPLYRSIQRGRESEEPILVYARTASGGRVPVSTSTAPLRNSDGEVVGGIETFRDESDNLRDLELAQRIQRNLLPESLPQSEGYTFDCRYYPHDLIGGDFYDVLRLGQDRWGVLLADVSGHGVSAALYTMQIKSIARAKASLAGSTGRFVAALNTELADFVVAEAFATACYAVVNTKTGEFTYSNAGHPQPLLYRAAERRAVPLSGAGVPLGILAGQDYDCHTCNLAPGDLVLFYTDGAAEVANETGEMLNTDGLAKLLVEELREQGSPSADLLERLYQKIEARCAAISLPDDLTLLSVARTT